MSIFRGIYKYWVTLMTVAVVVQIGFAGRGAFDAAHKADKGTLNDDAFSKSFDPHAGLGTLIVLAGFLLFLFALGTRDGRRIKFSGLVVVLLIAQILMGWNGASAPWILGLLHPIDVFIILGLLGSLGFREWKGERMMAAPEPASAPGS